jgi:hypothetical protein
VSNDLAAARTAICHFLTLAETGQAVAASRAWPGGSALARPVLAIARAWSP